MGWTSSPPPVPALATVARTCYPWGYPLLFSTALLLVTLPPTSSHNEGYSFLKPGKSFLEYHPHWMDTRKMAFQFTFRTFKSTTFLMHHELDGEWPRGEGGQGGEVAGTSLPQQPHLWVSLKKGTLKVTHVYKGLRETLNLAKGLNHDNWHRVSVTLDTETGHLIGEVDARGSHSRALDTLLDKHVQRAYGPGKRVSIVSLGGFSPPEARQVSSGFVGCIKAVRFLEGTRVLRTPLQTKAEVRAGCMDQCETDSPCIHGGTCINHYTHTTCDCYGTGFEGEHCQKEGLTAVTLQGAEWVGYNVYGTKERTHSPASRIAMEFKTSAAEGILFYAREQYPLYNHLAMSLHNGSLHVSVVFEDHESHNELFLTVGVDLSDDRWHRLSVTHHGQEVSINLDQEVEKMSTDYTHPHLHMPTTVFFGGTDVMARNQGLRTNKTYVGCLRGVYFNHVSVLEQLSSARAHYHGDAPLQYGCQDMTTTAIQFTHDGAFVKVEHAENEKLAIDLEFKTLKPNAVIAYTEVSVGAGKGYLKVVLREGSVQISVEAATQPHQLHSRVAVGHRLHNNNWHSLRLTYQSGLAQLLVDEQSEVMTVDFRYLTIGGATYLGFAPDITDMKAGYIGCMKKVRVQGGEVDPVRTLHSQLGVGITLGSCELTDWCLHDSPCLHRGQCVSEWRRAYCSCGHVPYTGQYCQFSSLRRSCYDESLVGPPLPPVVRVDPDGPGSLPPTYVRCRPSFPGTPHSATVTLVEHNLLPNTEVRAPGFKDFKKVLSYRAMSRAHLKRLVDQSAHCTQTIDISCNGAKLQMGHQTWMSGPSGNTFSSLGGDTDAMCGCGANHTCADDRTTCNCDRDAAGWARDGGVMSRRGVLPVTELTFLQTDGGLANLSLGPLTCSGSAAQSARTTVSLLTRGAHAAVGGWRGGGLQLMFRTTEPDALLLYQPHTNHTGPQLIVTLSENKIYVSLGDPAVHLSLTPTAALSAGQWRVLRVEVRGGQVRATVGEAHAVTSLPGGAASLRPAHPAPSLYVGGAPQTIDHVTHGLIGCVSGLVVNGELQQLAVVANHTAEVMAGCRGQCDSAPCRHGATCTEGWTDYTCRCTNVYAHQGARCENNINVDTVRFESSASLLRFAAPADSNLLHGNIIFSFRTTQPQAVILYIHDSFRNFIQVEVVNSNTIGVIFNSGKHIHNMSLPVMGLTSGTWRQVALLAGLEQLRLVVDEAADVKRIQRQPRLTHTAVTHTPAETVLPLGTLRSDGFEVLVGGVPEGWSHLPGLLGCVRGLQLGGKQYNLSRAAISAVDVSGGCRSGCDGGPCGPGGRCVHAPDRTPDYTCDCGNTAYSGRYCQTETGYYFNGETRVVEKLGSVLPRADGFRIRFYMTTATAAPLSRALVYIATGHTTAANESTARQTDELLVYLTSGGTLVAHLGLDSANSNVAVEHTTQCADGRPHHVTVEASGTSLSLQVDSVVEQVSIHQGALWTAPATLHLAAVPSYSSTLAHYANYTGDLYNVFLYSSSLPGVSARPLEVLAGLDDGQGGVTVDGHLAPAMGGLHGIASGAMYRTAAAGGGGGGLGGGEAGASPVTMPPWEPGEAQTVTLSTVGAGTDAPRAGVSPWVAFFICGLTIFIFLVMMVLLMARSRFRKGKFVPQKKRNQDEEEGLLDATPGERGVKAKATASQPKLRQVPRKSKNSKGSMSEEETPMLAEPQCSNTENQPEDPVEMTTFNGMDDFPMIDSDASDDNLYPTLTPEKRRKAPLLYDEDPEQKPFLLQDTPQGRPYAGTKEPSPVSSPVSDNIPMSALPPVPARRQTPDPSPQDTTPSLESQAGRAWTESQVLVFMEEAEEHGLEFPLHQQQVDDADTCSVDEDNTVRHTQRQDDVNQGHTDFAQQIAERSRPFDDSEGEDDTEPIEVTAEVYASNGRSRDGSFDPNYCDAATLPLDCRTQVGPSDDMSDDEEYVACPVEVEHSTGTSNDINHSAPNGGQTNSNSHTNTTNGLPTVKHSQGGAASTLCDDEEIVEDPIVDKPQPVKPSAGLAGNSTQPSLKGKRQSWAKQKTK